MTEENLNTIIEIISDLIIGNNQKIFTNLIGLNVGSKSITGLSMYLWSILDRVLVAYTIEQEEKMYNYYYYYEQEEENEDQQYDDTKNLTLVEKLMRIMLFSVYQLYNNVFKSD